MRTGQIARILGIARSTVNEWVHKKEIEPFFSLDALAKNSPQANYTQTDIDVLATIHHLRTKEKILKWSEIAKRLNAGERHADLPVSAVNVEQRTVTLREAEVSAKYLATVAERDMFAKRVQSLETQLKDTQSKHQADVERLLREIAELRYKLGALEAKQEQNKE